LLSVTFIESWETNTIGIIPLINDITDIKINSLESRKVSFVSLVGVNAAYERKDMTN